MTFSFLSPCEIKSTSCMVLYAVIIQKNSLSADLRPRSIFLTPYRAIALVTNPATLNRAKTTVEKYVPLNSYAKKRALVVEGIIRYQYLFLSAERERVAVPQDRGRNANENARVCRF